MAYIAEPFGPPIPAVVPPKPLPPDKVRYASIDALKGLAILAYWLVIATLGNPAVPDQLKPGPWGHPTFADCIFPALLVGIGAGIALSASLRQGRNALGTFMMGSLSRAFWLIVFGVLVESAVAHRFVLDAGALQLLGIAYLINALLAKTPVVLRFFLAEGLLLAFYAWAKLTYVPGSLSGTFNEQVNIIQYYDDKVLSPIGLQGIFALIPITSIVMSGSVLGSIYRIDESRIRRGLIFIACGGTLAFFGWLWSLDQPMVPALWTSSYALYATGFAVVALGLFNLLFDFEPSGRVASPLVIPGSSIILAITGPIFLKAMILDVWQWPASNATFSVAINKFIAAAFMPPLRDWAYAIVAVVLWWVILAITYHRRKWLREKCESY